MPTLSRYFVRSALICMAIGFTLGGLILAAKGGAVDVRVWALLPVHLALLLNGWLVQLSIGVAYWILPRISVGERGRRGLAWSAFILFQIGLGLTLISGVEPWWPLAGTLFAPSLILQLTAIVLFAVHAWPRIRPAMVRATQSIRN